MEYQRGRTFVETEGTRVARKGKRIFLTEATNPQDVGTFNRYVSYITHNPETKRLIIYLQKKFRIFPNVFAPLAATIEYYRNKDIKVILHNEINDFSETNFFEPLLATKSNLARRRHTSGIVWKATNSTEVNELVDSVIFEMSHKLVCEKGVLLGLEWSLNEMLDNIFEHSETKAAYFMYQFQEQHTRVSFCIADYGIGILRSFRHSKHKPRSPADAITLSVTEGVSRYDDQNRGNGLWGVLELIAQNKGQLTISSSGAGIFFNRERGVANTIEKIYGVDEDDSGTIIDVQVNPTAKVDVNSALKRSVEMVNLRLETLEDSYGDLTVQMKDRHEGHGTREAGRAFRTYLNNVLNESDGTVLVDFSGIGIVSSSFADEAFGLLFQKIGRDEFGKRLRFNNMSETVKLIMQNTLSLRATE